MTTAGAGTARGHVVRGGCLCGRVRYEVAGPLANADHCHCSMCRRQHGAAFAAISSEIPLGVMGEPRDVAFAALYLASEESRYVTGIKLNIDGGILAGSTAAPSDRQSG